MTRNHLHVKAILLSLILCTCCAHSASARTVELRGKITQLSGGLPATAVLRCEADESFAVSTVVHKEDSTFTFQVEVPRAGLYYLRIFRSALDIMLTAQAPTTNILLTFDGEAQRDFQIVRSPENDAYKAFKTASDGSIIMLMNHFKFCQNEDSCEKVLHGLLTGYAQELADIEQRYKGTYTAQVLCPMKMPVIAKNEKNTTAEFRKGYFEKVDFSDSTILATPIYKDMLATYAEFLIEPLISKENQFVKYFTDRIRSNPAVLHKSAVYFFDDLYRAQHEKMLDMFIAWYNTGDNKTAVNNPVLDTRVKGISAVMPGQQYIDISAPDTAGIPRKLGEVIGRSKCTLLIFWSSECSHCRDEMPYIKEYYEKYHAKGLDIFGVSIEPDSVKWKKFVKEKELAWTNVLYDRNANPNQISKYVVTNTPTMILIDHQGMILHRFIPKNKLEERIVEALK